MIDLSAEMTKHPENSKDYIDLVLVIKYIERMADHANNIAEWLIYRDTNEIRSKIRILRSTKPHKLCLA